MPNSHSPLPQKPLEAVPAPDQAAYQFNLLFNARAELIKVESPENLSTAKVAEHLAAALHYLTQVLSAEDR